MLWNKNNRRKVSSVSPCIDNMSRGNRTSGLVLVLLLLFDTIT